MPLAPVIAAALTTPTTRFYGLYVDGVDVSSSLSSAGKYGVSTESIRISEQGLEGVSALTFTVDDPNNVVSVRTGATVRFHDFTLDEPRFLGWVQAYTVRANEGSLGREIDVLCQGIESVLDWSLITDDLTITTAENIDDAINKVLPYVQGPVLVYYVSGLETGDATRGIANLFGTNGVSYTIPAGTSVRNAILEIRNQHPQIQPYFDTGSPVLLTVDFYGYVRLLEPVSGINGATLVPTGATATYYSTWSYSTSSNQPEGLDYTVDQGAVMRNAFVAGATAATYVEVGDGSGIPGPTAFVADSSIATNDTAGALAAAELAKYANEVRGTLSWSAVRSSSATSTTRVHSGSLATITFPVLGLSGSFRIHNVETSFSPSGEERKILSFGGPLASGAALLRRLTRSTTN